MFTTISAKKSSTSGIAITSFIQFVSMYAKVFKF